MNAREYLARKIMRTEPTPVYDVINDHLRRVQEAEAKRRHAERETQIRQAIDEYLLDLPSSGWGQFFTISDPDRRAECVDYIYHVFKGVDAHLSQGAR